MPFDGPGEARDAIYTFFVNGLAAQLPSWTNPIIIYDGKHVPDPPDDTQPYLRVELRHTDRKQRTVGGAGGRRFRAKFTLTIKVLTKLGEGNDDYKVGATTFAGADSIVKAMEKTFEGKTTGIDAAQFYHVRSREYGEFEGRWLVLIIVDGDYDTVR